MSFFTDTLSDLRTGLKDIVEGSQDVVSLGKKVTKHARDEVIGAHICPNATLVFTLQPCSDMILP
jgi:hypothetical protein